MTTPSMPIPEPEETGGESSRRDDSPRESGHRDFDEEFERMMGTGGIAPGPTEPTNPPDSSDCSDPGGAADAGPTDGAAVEDDEVLPGDFVPPDPDLPKASDSAVWSWTALLGGVLLALLAGVLDSIPTWAGALGGIAAVGGLVALIARVPADRSDPTDGAQV